MESEIPPEGPEPYWNFLHLLIASDISTVMVVAPLCAVAVLLLCSGLVSGSEIAFFSFKPKDIAELNESSQPSAKRILKLIYAPRYLLATILIANNLINISITIISYVAFSQIFDFNELPETWGAALEFLINLILVVFLTLLFGEVAPKIYASQNKLKLASFMSAPLMLLKTFFTPLSAILVSSSRLIEKRFEKRSNGEIDYSTLDQAIELTVENESTPEEINILKGIIHFGNTAVKQIMRPRVEVFALDKESSYSEIMPEIRSKGYSRIPVYTENLDTVEGVLYVKDLLMHIDKTDDFDWTTLMREAFFVPETKKIDDLLKEMQQNRIHLAVVVDEYGGTSGIVTLEDILEEVVGEIGDEFDDLVDNDFRRIDDSTIIVEGKMPINDLCRVMNLPSDTFDEIRGDADSVAGIVLELAGVIPARKDEVTYENYKFTVLKVEDYRIDQLRLEILGDSDDK